MSRHAAYRWLAQEMRLPKSYTHIGLFDKEQCQRAIAVVNELLKRSYWITKAEVKKK